MKVYISADIEGVAGISHWDEATKTHATYPEFRDRMTDEVVAACDGAIAAGARKSGLRTPTAVAAISWPPDCRHAPS